MVDQAQYERHRNCGHAWEPVGFFLDPVVRQPDIVDARCYMICRKCNGWTYDLFEWVGFRLDGPDALWIEGDE